MPRILSNLSLIAILAMGTSLSAQEATTEAEAAQAVETPTEAVEGAAPADAATAAQGLDQGREVDEDPSYIKATYGDWQMKCFRTGTAEDLCQMYQLLTEEAGNPVAEFSLYRLPKSAPVVAGATIAVPLGTLLNEEIKIAIDGGKAKSYAYSFCTMGGCFARIGLAQADVDALKRGVMATLEIVPAQAPDQKVKISVSLNGFTAAFDNASVLEQ
ncbi:Invasion protein IalB, involved in pathogenesis [Roseovarius marisflavi]|uniref:Invasion protein IalB, involved in pathogenesis n=1 Tax=Roseovarius marisflavi TaxID=1054996 RepID=A0A1M6VI73_9RHOB|nr:invasion associated locus B family protein [Roseovarius marisflavi]SHK81055.1 Invasion protein IalB, involved in pathogenesis [Roseovarius marisflavi]